MKKTNKQMRRIDFSIVIPLRAHPRRARRPPLSETITHFCWRNARLSLCSPSPPCFLFMFTTIAITTIALKTVNARVTPEEPGGACAHASSFFFFFYSFFPYTYYIYIYICCTLISLTFTQEIRGPDSDCLRRALVQSNDRYNVYIAVDHRLFRYGYIIISQRDRHRSRGPI